VKESWQSKKLGDLCDIGLGKTPARDNPKFWDTAKLTENVWLSIADLLSAPSGVAVDSKEYLSALGAALSKPVKRGTLLVSFKLTLGRLAFAGRDLFTNEAIAALTIRDAKNISKEFLCYFLRYFDWDEATVGEEKVKGKTLNKAKLKEIVVQFPRLTEQQRMVAILDKAFASIATVEANAKQNLRNARELFDSYLRSLFFESHTGWARKTLREVATDFGRGKSKHRPRNDPKLYGGPYPFIQTGDVRGADQLITEYTQTYNDAGLAQSKLWPKGTLCITIAANIAETGILGFDACFPDSVIGVVVDQRQTSTKFLEYLLQTVKAALKAKGKGSAQDNINLGTFENERFPFPDLTTQASIVEKLDTLSAAVREMESVYDRKLAALDELKQALLAKAFAGELT
jgi:type I restriction enzyme, S subunit